MIGLSIKSPKALPSRILKYLWKTDLFLRAVHPPTFAKAMVAKSSDTLPEILSDRLGKLRKRFAGRGFRMKVTNKKV